MSRWSIAKMGRMSLPRAAAIVVGLCVAAAATGAWAEDGGMPFSNTYRRPSVNPMTMMGTGFGGDFDNVAATGLVYQQLVQPRNQQEQQFITQMQQGRALNTLQGRVSQSERRVTAQFQQVIRPTGHSSTFMNRSHYYSR